MADKTMLNVLRIRAVDEDIWRTINSAKVLIDGDDGTIKGGAGGKMNGMKYKPSWGKSAKTGKKVLKPFKAKFSHFKGTKKELLEKLKKAAEPPKQKKHYKDVYEEYNELGKLNYKMTEAKTLEELDAAYENWQKKFEEYEKSYADLDTDAMNHDDMTNSLAEYVLLQKDHLKQLDFGALEDFLAVKKTLQVKKATEDAKEVWKKIVKAKNALKDAKSLKAKLGNQQKLADAWDEYHEIVENAPGEIGFKPNTKVVWDIIMMPAEQLATFGHKKKGQGLAAEPPKASGKVSDPFITPLTTPGGTNRQKNIETTINTLHKLTEAFKGNNSKYEITSLKHMGVEGWKKNQLPPKSDDMKVHKKMVDECSKVWKDATPAEKQAIHEYTQSYSKFNEPLRGIEYGSNKFVGVGKVDMDNVGVKGYGGFKKGYAKKLINDMTDIIDKSSYNFDVQVRRGVSTAGAAKLLGIDESVLHFNSEEDLKNALEGKLCTEFGFASCGVADGKGFHGEVELRILCPAGTKMMYAEPFSSYGNGAKSNSWDGVDKQSTASSEHEVILQRNTRFQVQRVRKINGRVQVELQVVAQDPTQFD